jgi:phenylalanyl-tRNA synthetase alpha subunit
METGTETNTSVVEETAEAAPHDENLTEDSLDEVIDNFTLDDLMAYGEEQDPLFADEAQHKGMKPLNEWIHNVPEDVRKHLANIRADYTRKTQELSRMRKEVEEAQRAMRQQNENIINGSTAKLTANIDETAEYDLFDPEGMKAEIQRQAQIMLRDMLKPAQEELQVQQRKLQLEQFKAENPELTDPEYRTEIVNLLKTRPELSMEDAFYITKAKIGSTKLQQERQEIADRRARQREVVRKSSSGSRSQPKGTPKFKNALEAYKWHKAQQTK